MNWCVVYSNEPSPSIHKNKDKNKNNVSVSMSLLHQYKAITFVK